MHPRVKWLATIGLLVGLAGSVSVQNEWPTYHGAYSLTGIASAELPDRPRQLWRFDTEDRVDAPPIAGGGRIYVTTARRDIFALDYAGKTIWTKELEDDKFSSPPMFANDTVFVGTRKGQLIAFAAATGKERWRYDVGGTIQGSANRVDLANGKHGVIVTSQADGAIHCVDIATGEIRWKTGAIERCDGSPGVGGDRIILGSCAAAMHVFSVAQAKKTMDIALGDESQVAGGVALSGSMAYAGSRSGALFAVNVATGVITWSNTDSKGEAFTTPAVGEKHVLFGSDDGNTYCLDRATGKKVWHVETEDSPLSPVIAGKRVVVSAGGTLLMMDIATGKKVWAQRVSDYITSPSIINGMIVVAADDGTVTAYGAKR